MLNKPMGIVSNAIELGYRFTLRGMQRTFNDLARRAKLEMLVVESIFGHKTDDLMALYSTIGSNEQRQGQTTFSA